MKNGFFSSIAVCLAAATLTVAQEPSAALDGSPGGVSPFPASAPCSGQPGEDIGVWAPCPASPSTNCFWIGSDYLLWRIKDAPLPVPVITTTTQPGFIPSPGGLGQPGTIPLYGGSPINLGTFSGTRATVGGWLNSARTIGVEGSAFLLEERSAFFTARSDANGNPFLGFPILDTVSGTETAIPVTFPLTAAGGSTAFGGVAVASSSRLWGSELNGLFNVARSEKCAVDLIAGFRYLSLQESLTISGNDFQTDFSSGVSTLTGITVDSFGTRNQFYGGQVGARLSWTWQKLFLNAAGKVALGQSHEVVTTNGSTQAINPTGIFVGAPPVSLGGVYTQPTNIGRYSANPFTAIPELQLKIGYALTPGCRVYVGYDVLYWGNVMRPGDQVDHVLNTSTFSGTLVGPAQPSPLLRQSDFWAQGVSFGVQFSF